MKLVDTKINFVEYINDKSEKNMQHTSSSSSSSKLFIFSIFQRLIFQKSNAQCQHVIITALYSIRFTIDAVLFFFSKCSRNLMPMSEFTKKRKLCEIRSKNKVSALIQHEQIFPLKSIGAPK